MRSLAVAINDTAIKTHAADVTVGELADLRSSLQLRFHKSRTKGTWCLVRYEQGIKKRYRIGYWPALKTKDAQAMVPDLLQRIGKGEQLQSTEFSTVGQLLNWYLQRIEQETVKSQSRRKGVVSAIKQHLLPRMEKILLCDVKKITIDERLMLPLQNASLKPSTIRQYFAVLKRVFASANELGLLTVNPMAGMKFSDHVQKRILPKFGKLQVQDIGRVGFMIMDLPDHIKHLLLFMLLFATRIGETRQLRWNHICFDSEQIVIPDSITKTGVVHVLPLTRLASSLLRDFKQQANGPYLFGGNEPISASEADKQIRSVSRRQFSAHDLRKAARSAWAELGIDYWVAERLLNHKPKGLDLVYIGGADSLKVKREALERYHEWLFVQLEAGQKQAMKAA
ncbi:site-specific integrase [Alishewanella sp. SMS8]|uniref:tyrosine-type recombinase/integrase n=1 Tax=Alishewanella sp. SMS8 TaxID=2994676 RepID=UPI0027416022|nr:site-specific integrase [Alishewanella sp. SMS8]MDP5207387.1 tyrosine-type recombinase/integrase [Alishewanella sp. SMS9]MDP5459869.1 tyrosine-type recombinase/integrase [Alishewanella sp. SMS8]